MKWVLALCMVFSCAMAGRAQLSSELQMQKKTQADSLITELTLINERVAASRADLISNRAMNIFISNKMGYYLSSVDDPTLYKNSVVGDAAAGTVAINHNLYQAKGADNPVRSFTSIGVQANVADAFSAAAAGRQYNNQFGFLLKQSWAGKVTTRTTAASKYAMDALRAGILHSLAAEIRQKTAAFDQAIAAFDSASETPGQSSEAAQATARQQFGEDLKTDYEYKFALLQSDMLASTFYYNSISTSWTSLNLYLPLITENFPVAPSVTNAFSTRHAFPVQITLSHTAFREAARGGKFYCKLAGSLGWNNARDGFGLERYHYADYVNAGGTDSVGAGRYKADWLYVGMYKSFLTPSLTGQFVYLPPNSHVGLSFKLEQYFGDYHALNGVIGVPIVLINKQAEPAIDFEFQVRFFDMASSISGADRGMPGKTSIGFTVGVPFSKIAY